MATKYALKPALKTFKRSFYLEDENGTKIYEGNMTKFKLLGASPYEFINHVTNHVEEHKLGKTVTVEQGSGLIGELTKKSYFKFDGQKIWDYLHDQGIRINSRPLGNKLGMSYEISLKGQPLATVAMSSPKGKSIVTTNLYYEVICEEKDLDIVFLVAFSIAMTEQTVYN